MKRQEPLTHCISRVWADLSNIQAFFKVGAFICQKSQLLQSLFFFFFFQDNLEATNVNVQLKKTKRKPGRRI